MTISVPFQSQFNWQKLGYLYYSSSLSYREVLEQNPQWTVTELPPLGAQLLIDGDGNTESVGGLTQGSTIYGVDVDQDPEFYFPFESKPSYDEALYRYTLQGVVDRDTVNGITFDSVQAITGNQKG